MKAESLQWRTLRPHLVKARLDPVRVENPIHPGTPDVNLGTGAWIELKTIAAWAAAHKITPIRHFTPQQRVWLYRRWHYAPGTTFLLLEVRAGRQWLLFEGPTAAKVVGRATAAAHLRAARAVLDARDLASLASYLQPVAERKAAA